MTICFLIPHPFLFFKGVGGGKACSGRLQVSDTTHTFEPRLGAGALGIYMVFMVFAVALTTSILQLFLDQSKALSGLVITLRLHTKTCHEI